MIDCKGGVNMKTLKFILSLICLITITFITSGQELPEGVTNIYNLQSWIRNNITYSQEEEKEAKFIDYWQTPEETIKWKSGDCEDFCFLYKHFLEKLGYKTTVYACYYASYGHAIALFIHRGKYVICSNSNLHFTNYTTSIRAILNSGLNKRKNSILKIYRIKENCIYGKMQRDIVNYNTKLVWRKSILNILRKETYWD